MTHLSVSPATRLPAADRGAVAGSARTKGAATRLEATGFRP